GRAGAAGAVSKPLALRTTEDLVATRRTTGGGLLARAPGTLPPHTQAGNRSVRPGPPGCARMAREARKPSRKRRAGDRYPELLRLGRHLLDDAGDWAAKGRKA